MSVERFQALHPHAWLLTGWKKALELPSSTRSLEVQAHAGQATEALQQGPAKLELLPLRVADGTHRSEYFSIGRGSSSDVGLPFPSVSKRHAILTFHQGAWALTDQNSTNGTWLDERPLLPDTPAPLPEEVTLRFGTVPCIFLLRSSRLHALLTGA